MPRLQYLIGQTAPIAETLKKSRPITTVRFFHARSAAGRKMTMSKTRLDRVRAALSIATLNLEQAYYLDSAQKCREALAALDAEKGAEPVAWELRVDGRWKGCLRHKGLVDQITKSRDVEITPLYASPPQAAPSVADKVLRDALERAHGCINGLLKRTPVRDVSETLAEIERALTVVVPAPPK